MSSASGIVALVPARSGSLRVTNKNTRILGSHPLIAYTIASAIDSAAFDDVVVSTDSREIADLAAAYGASVPFLRPARFAAALSPDIEWVRHALESLQEQGREYEMFSILRPTSPFRTADTIRRARDLFLGQQGVDSLRAVELCTEHPMKMWVIRGGRLLPLFPFGPESPPWHSSAYQSLPEIYVQNASLEIAWTRVVSDHGTIAGTQILPFVTEGYEGFDINNPADWSIAERLLEEGIVAVPAALRGER